LRLALNTLDHEHHAEPDDRALDVLTARRSLDVGGNSTPS